MKEIELNNLTDPDFEVFSKDILAYKLKIPFRSFKRGKDKGIDCICLEEKNWIIQAKCYKETQGQGIISNLKKEVAKVKKLKPERYFLFIMKPLGVSQFQEILEMFSPYLKKEDIYDAIMIKDILNEKDAEYLLEKWDKLWLPSPYFAQKFYEKFQKSKYEYEKRQIIEESKIFVETENYLNARKMLDEKNVILIHGEPGAGKTVLARRLALKYIFKGFDFIYEHANDMKDIETYLYDERNKVIIIDDFLGQSTFELRAISDNKLYNIINYSRKNNNIKLILTTRSYIFNNSKQILEKFSETADKLEKVLIEVNKYSDSDKKRILYNHLYYNGLLWSAEYVEIVRSGYYNNIIHNRNFTPRNIEKICEIIKEKRPDNVIETIDKFLDNPEEIWEYEYQKLDESKFGKYLDYNQKGI